MRLYLRPLTGLALLCSAVVGLAPHAAAAITVNCATQNLQNKINSAPPGSTLLIKGTCVGNFTVDKNLRLKGNPTATLDGHKAGRTLYVSTPSNVHLMGLVVTGGRAMLGGGILTEGGSLSLNGMTVRGNRASGSSATGGGIYSLGSLTIESSSIVNNKAVASATGSASASAGGIYSDHSTILSLSDISSNTAKATSTSGAANATGGGVWVEPATLTVAGSSVDGNRASSTGATIAFAFGGGAGQSANTEALSITGSSFTGNAVSAHATTTGAQIIASAGGFQGTFDTGSISRSRFVNNSATATSSAGRAIVRGGAIEAYAVTRLSLTSVRTTGSVIEAIGSTQAIGEGGGVYLEGRLTVRNSSISKNSMSVHSGTDRATGIAGGIYHTDDTPFSMVRSTVQGNRVTAHSTGADAFSTAGGFDSLGPGTVAASTISGNTTVSIAEGTFNASAFTGGLELGGAGPFSVVNSTITGNSVRAVASPTQGEARAAAGGLEITDETLHVINSTVARNHVSASAETMHAKAGGLADNSSTDPILKGTILALNTAPVGPDCFGNVASAGHNLLRNKTACIFASTPTDKLGKDPKLGPLANNGGPTKTLALLSGSPALNAIPKAACAVKKDQRGVSRPQGRRCDIGAYERKA